MKCPIFCSLGFSVGNVIFNEKVSLTNSMGDTNSRELASPTELVSSSHSRVDELPLSVRIEKLHFGSNLEVDNTQKIFYTQKLSYR